MRFAATAAALLFGRMTATDSPDRRLCIKKRFLLLTEAEGVFFFLRKQLTDACNSANIIKEF